jgi:hypothetical protein
MAWMQVAQLTGIMWLALASAPPYPALAGATTTTQGRISVPKPAAQQNVDVSWVPPATVGMRLPAMTAQPTDRALVRKPWCNFGRHAQRFAVTGAVPDIVFRKPTQQARTELNQIRENITNPENYKSASEAEARFNKLVRTTDGPAMVRITLLDSDERMELLGLKAAKAIVALQPRLAAFATGYLSVKDPALATAAVELHFASECDTAVLYGLDGFRHPDEGVQLATLRMVYLTTQNHENLRLVDRIAALLADGVGTPRARVAALRVMARVGALATSNYAEALLKDKDDVVAAEALATLAVLQPARAGLYATKWLKDKSPQKRAGALRAYAQVFAVRQDLADTVIRPLMADPTPLADPSGLNAGLGKTLGDVARAAVAYMALE